jgi:hypothetical protein
MRSTGGAGDVELGTVKHVNMVALNGDGMNADIKAAFEERKANYANLRYDASVKRCRMWRSCMFNYHCAI